MLTEIRNQDQFLCLFETTLLSEGEEYLHLDIRLQSLKTETYDSRKARSHFSIQGLINRKANLKIFVVLYSGCN